MGEESLFKIRLAVDFDDFEEVIFYRRGESRKKETLVKFFGLKKVPIEFTNYDRVAIYIKFKEADYFEAKKRKSLYFTPAPPLSSSFRTFPKRTWKCSFPTARSA